MHQTENVPQLRSRVSRARQAVSMAAKKRRVKGPTDQRKITLPMFVWDLLEQAAELHTDAYKINKGETKFTVSDAIEIGVEMFLLSLREDLGPMPSPTASKSEREAWVKRLAAQISKDILEEYFSKKSH